MDAVSTTKRAHITTIEKNRLVYIVSNVFGHAYILVTIPLLTRHLSPDEFGFYTILVQIITITQSASLVLFSNALIRFYVDYDGQERNQFVGTIGVTFVALQILVAVLVYIGRYRLFPILFPNITVPLDPYVLYAAVWMCLVSSRGLALTLAKVLEKPWLTLSQVVIYGVLLIPLLYWIVVIKGKGLLGALESLILAETVSLVLLTLPLTKHVSLGWRWQYLKKCLIFSAPLAASSMLFVLFGNTDRIVLSRYVSIAELGIYGIGFLIGNIAALVVTANASSFYPRMLKVMKSEGDKAAKAVGTYFMGDSLALMALCVAGLTVLNGALVSYLGQAQAVSSASMVVTGIALGHLVRCQFLFYYYSLSSRNRTGVILFLYVMLLGAGFVTSHLFARYWGIQGASFMSMTSHALILAPAFWLTKRYFYIPFPIRPALKTVSFIILLVSAELYLARVGWSVFTTRYWIVKAIEIAITVVFYGKYLAGMVKPLLRQRVTNL